MKDLVSMEIERVEPCRRWEERLGFHVGDYKSIPVIVCPRCGFGIKKSNAYIPSGTQRHKHLFKFCPKCGTAFAVEDEVIE